MNASKATAKRATTNTGDGEQAVFDLMVRALRQRVQGKHAVAAILRRKAIHLAKRLLSRHPSARLWTMLGDVYVSSKQSELCYRQALRLDPSFHEAAYELAMIEYHEKHNIRAALKLVNLCVKRPPGDIAWLIYDFAATVYSSCNLKKEARRAKRNYKYSMKGGFANKTVAMLDPDWHTPDPQDPSNQRHSRQSGKLHSRTRAAMVSDSDRRSA